jgi:hypothetical protein
MNSRSSVYRANGEESLVNHDHRESYTMIYTRMCDWDRTKTFIDSKECTTLSDQTYCPPSPRLHAKSNLGSLACRNILANDLVEWSSYLDHLHAAKDRMSSSQTRVYDVYIRSLRIVIDDYEDSVGLGIVNREIWHMIKSTIAFRIYRRMSPTPSENPNVNQNGYSNVTQSKHSNVTQIENFKCCPMVNGPIRTWWYTMVDGEWSLEWIVNGPWIKLWMSY